MHVPLATDSDGVVRVGGTRVTLDTVVGAFTDGATPEEIGQRYPTLDLADVYAVLAYFLRHRDEVDEYLRLSEALAAQIRQQIESQLDAHGIRDRLLARRERTRAMSHAAVGACHFSSSDAGSRLTSPRKPPISFTRTQLLAPAQAAKLQ